MQSLLHPNLYFQEIERHDPDLICLEEVNLGILQSNTSIQCPSPLGGLLLIPLEPSGQFGFCRGLGAETFVAMSEVQGDFFCGEEPKFYYDPG